MLGWMTWKHWVEDVVCKPVHRKYCLVLAEWYQSLQWITWLVEVCRWTGALVWTSYLSYWFEVLSVAVNKEKSMQLQLSEIHTSTFNWPHVIEPSWDLFSYSSATDLPQLYYQCQHSHDSWSKKQLASLALATILTKLTLYIPWAYSGPMH